jgi:hypothetical protein
MVEPLWDGIRWLSIVDARGLKLLYKERDTPRSSEPPCFRESQRGGRLAQTDGYIGRISESSNTYLYIIHNLGGDTETPLPDEVKRPLSVELCRSQLN